MYLVWGKAKDHYLNRSITSLQKHHPELPVHVEKLPQGSNLLEETRITSSIPFESTLFLDIDTVVLGRLDFGFQKAEEFGLACCICECPWANRYEDPRLRGEIIEFNTGVLFFTEKSNRVLSNWSRNANEIDSSITHIVNGKLAVMPEND